jgi:hypothetical protein
MRFAFKRGIVQHLEAKQQQTGPARTQQPSLLILRHVFRDLSDAVGMDVFEFLHDAARLGDFYGERAGFCAKAEMHWAETRCASAAQAQ